MPSSADSLRNNIHSQTHLQSLLNSARPFLRGELDSVHKNIPSLVAVLCSAGAGERWHKHGSFLQHLVDMYRILKIWKAPECLCLCGLFHSANSNSYVNLAIFDPSTGRDVVRAHVGDEAERLIHLFCTVPRQPLILDELLFQFSDSELVEYLKNSEISVSNAKENGAAATDGGEIEAWRKKLQAILPADGIKVKHIRTGEDVQVSRRIVAVFLMMTIADFSDQLFSFQDMLFDNSNGRLEFTGSNYGAIWPGDGKPGLWLNSISRMAALYTLIAREEEIFMQENKHRATERDEEIELVVPPIFDNCTKVLDARDQIVARDMYWEAVCNYPSKAGLTVEELLLGSIEKNPFVGEPYVVLSQVYLTKGEYEEAEKHA